jgi:hypothetical protein
MRPARAVAVALLGLLALLPDARAQTAPTTGKAAKAARSAFTPEREAAALTFVARHHPELAALLERLKPMNRGEYEKAIGELFRASENLAALRDRDPRRHALMLDAWKARSRVDLLAAQFAAQPSPEGESALRAAIEAQMDVELAQNRFERELAAARLKRADDAIARLTKDRDRAIANRLESLRKKGQRPRAAATAAPGRPARPRPSTSPSPSPMGEPAP